MAGARFPATVFLLLPLYHLSLRTLFSLHAASDSSKSNRAVPVAARTPSPGLGTLMLRSKPTQVATSTTLLEPRSFNSGRDLVS
ncbi:hypothetical protein JCM5296_004880 [Sporobolomyces johnsonii]